MSLTLSDPARNAAVDAVLALLNVGGAGSLQIGTAGFGSIYATLTLSNPAFAAAASGTAIANSITADTNTSAGSGAAAFRLRNNAGTTVITGTVGTSGADIIVGSTTFTAGGICSVSSLSYTQPAS